MRTISLTLLILIFKIHSFCQGNLQFNRVINYSFPTTNATGTPPTCGGTIIIPENKVWKIESSGIKSEGGNSQWALYIDNYALFSWQVNFGSNTTNQYWQSPYPIWLPSGNFAWKATFFSNNFSSFSFPGASMSVIEYNIIPQ
jgi:hypothetical protein